jgi:hypothetical protein
LKDGERKRIKVYNRIFTEACYCFINLMPYFGHMSGSLRRATEETQADRERLRLDAQKNDKAFDDRVWKDLQIIYGQLYPRFLNYSLLVSACSIFEYQLKRICELVRDEHKMPFSWDMSGSKASMLVKVRRYLKFAGVILTDDPPRIELQPPDFKPTEVFDENRVVIKVLWQSLNNYFMVRNNIVHDNGVIGEARNPEKLQHYATEKGIIEDNHGHAELSITPEFIREVCDTMEKFFWKVQGAYYSTPLPE